MMLPTIHNNGTSKRALIEANCEASSALRLALEALAAACPNARDYYPQGPGAFNLAMREHEARIGKLRDVYKELEALTIAIDDI